MAFTSGMVTSYKVGLLFLTTDVLNDKLSVQEIKGYSEVSTTHTHTAPDVGFKKSHLVFITFTLVFLFKDNS